MNLDYLNECFSWDYDGNLSWKERPRHHFKSDGRHKWFLSRFANKPAGSICKPTGYHQVGVSGQVIGAHRILYMLYNNIIIPDKLQVDHVDGNRTNNIFKNLRLGTRRENGYNTGKRKDNTTGYKGVCFSKYMNKYSSYIRASGNKQKHLGFFDTAEEAHEAYKAAAMKYHGEFSNFG